MALLATQVRHERRLKPEQKLELFLDTLALGIQVQVLGIPGLGPVKREPALQKLEPGVARGTLGRALRILELERALRILELARGKLEQELGTLGQALATQVQELQTLAPALLLEVPLPQERPLHVLTSLRSGSYRMERNELLTVV